MPRPYPRGRRLMTTSFRAAHAMLVADGWQLEDGLPDDAPQNAVAQYRKDGERALLVATDGEYYLITDQPEGV